MAVLNFVDRYSSTLASGYTAGGGTLSVTSAAGLPSGACNFYVLVAAEGSNTEEFFQVTNVTGTTLTVVGAQAGTSASNHASGAVIIGSQMTAAAFDGMRSDQSQLGTFATLPATTGQKAGNVYRCTDCPYWFAFNGSAWQAFYESFPVTIPPDLSSWSNHSSIGTSVVDQNFGGIRIVPQNTAVSRVWRLIYRAQPSTPYVITARLLFSAQSSIDAEAGIGFMDNSGVFEMFGAITPAGLNWQQFNSDTSFHANYFTTSYAWKSGLVHLRMSNDGANKKVYVANDGVNWIELASASVSTWITPTRVAFGSYDNNATPSGVSNSMSAVTLMSWEVT